MAPLDENDYSPGEDQTDSISSQNKSPRPLAIDHANSDFPSLLNVPLGSDGQASHDSHNDSGYSTRFGYSAGPSPSLSGMAIFLFFSTRKNYSRPFMKGLKAVSPNIHFHEKIVFSVSEL